MTDGVSLDELPRPAAKLRTGQRITLPHHVENPENYSIWEIIKPNIGKDFSRFAVPIYLNEPLNFLQRLAEYLQYSNLIGQAAAQKDPIDRMAYVGSFAISALSSNWNRLSKPFNPLLHETFELERNGIRFVAEQVSHHPPISALHAESSDFVMDGTVAPKMSIGINKLICTPNAKFRLMLKKSKEIYTWESPLCSIHNVMLGKLYMNLTGTMTVKCKSRDLQMNLKFDADRGWHVKTTDVHVDGWIYHGKTKVRGIYGNWAYYLAMCDVDVFKTNFSKWQKLFKESLQPGNENHAPMMPDSTTLWVAYEMPEDYTKIFHFTYFTLSLNELYEDEESRLPPTDCRRRPDVTHLEKGEIESAEEHKARLEEAQRKRRKDGQEGSPRWFRQEDSEWIFTLQYWKRDWSDCMDIFGINDKNSVSSEES